MSKGMGLAGLAKLAAPWMFGNMQPAFIILCRDCGSRWLAEVAPQTFQPDWVGKASESVQGALETLECKGMCGWLPRFSKGSAYASSSHELPQTRRFSLWDGFGKFVGL